MKKIFLLLSLGFFCVGGFAAYNSSDFTNQPYISINLKDYSSREVKVLLGKMQGDTIQVTYTPKFPSYKTTGYRIEFELAKPDTIWIKQVKKPKLNKHYYLCRAYKGLQMEGVNYPDGSPFFRTENLSSELFVLNRLLDTDEIGRLRVELTEVASGAIIIWHIENKCEVVNISLQNRVNAQLKAEPVYVGEKSEYSSKKYYQVSSVKATFKYDISASVYSTSYSSITNYVTDYSKISFSIPELDSSKKVLFYYIPEGSASYATYKFIPKETAEKYFAEKAAAEAKAAQLAREDERMDSTFFLAIKLDNYVRDALTNEFIDSLGNRTAFVYSILRKDYSTYYMAYCHGRQLHLSSYFDAIENADKDKIDYLQRRGKKGIELREQIAIQKDKEQIEIDKVKAVEFAKKCKIKKDEFVKKQIFLIEHFYSTGEYHRCGLGVNFFNCFNKTIKYVEMTVSAYNRFYDPQRDDIGNSSKSVRCIGPIAPKETGYYLFNELFWNENYVIHDCRATSIKIIFTDNSSISYSGWANIKKHYQEFFFDSRNIDYAQ